jgi:hypothetical protein
MKILSMSILIAATGVLISGCATRTPQTVPAGWNEAHKTCIQLRETVGIGTKGPSPHQVYVDCMRRAGYEV